MKCFFQESRLTLLYIIHMYMYNSSSVVNEKSLHRSEAGGIITNTKKRIKVSRIGWGGEEFGVWRQVAARSIFSLPPSKSYRTRVWEKREVGFCTLLCFIFRPSRLQQSFWSGICGTVCPFFRLFFLFFFAWAWSFFYFTYKLEIFRLRVIGIVRLRWWICLRWKSAQWFVR